MAIQYPTPGLKNTLSKENIHAEEINSEFHHNIQMRLMLMVLYLLMVMAIHFKLMILVRNASAGPIMEL